MMNRIEKIDILEIIDSISKCDIMKKASEIYITGNNKHKLCSDNTNYNLVNGIPLNSIQTRHLHNAICENVARLNEMLKFAVRAVDSVGYFEVFCRSISGESYHISIEEHLYINEVIDQVSAWRYRNEV